MERSTVRWQAVAVAAAMAAGRHVASAQGTVPVEPAEGAAFSAVVTVERSIVDERGKVARELPRSRYRIQRFAGGRSRMTMLASTPEPRVGPMADAYAGLVVEFDPAGGLRVLGKDGRPMPGASPLPGGLMPAELTGDADSGMVAASHDAPVRRRELTRHFGSRSGTVRRLERYLTKSGSRLQEVLVSPATALPVEVNIVNDGVLEEHHEFAYEERTLGRLVRTRTRSESRVPGPTRERLVSVTTLSDVRMNGGAE